tara:strand:+ start:489 stop:677 length:189 start_codon:yes stop_codon:yes gene_type:complete
MSDKNSNKVILENIQRDMKVIHNDIFLIKNSLKSIQDVVIQKKLKEDKDKVDKEISTGWWFG